MESERKQQTLSKIARNLFIFSRPQKNKKIKSLLKLSSFFFLVLQLQLQILYFSLLLSAYHQAGEAPSYKSYSAKRKSCILLNSTSSSTIRILKFGLLSAIFKSHLYFLGQKFFVSFLFIQTSQFPIPMNWTH